MSDVALESLRLGNVVCVLPLWLKYRHSGACVVCCRRIWRIYVSVCTIWGVEKFTKRMSSSLNQSWRRIMWLLFNAQVVLFFFFNRFFWVSAVPIARVSVSLSLIVSNVRSKVSRSLPQLCRTHGWGASQLNQSSIRSQHCLHFTSTYPQNLHIHPPKLKLQLVSRFCSLQQCTWIIELLWRCRWCECEWIQIQIRSITVLHHIYNI